RGSRAVAAARSPWPDPSAAPSCCCASRPRRHRMATFLVVDDDESNRVTLSALLELEGHDVALAASAGAARDLFERTPCVDVVVLDQHLGDGSGSELIPIARAQWPLAKVLLMSGSLAAHDAFPEGADGCFVKGDGFD